MHYCKLYIQLVVRFKCLYVTVDPLSPSHLITMLLVILISGWLIFLLITVISHYIINDYLSKIM